MSGTDWIGAILLTFHTALSGGGNSSFPLLLIALTAAWVILSAIPAVLLSAADEGSLLMIEPGQTLSDRSEAVWLTALGGLVGAIVLAFAVPALSSLLPALHRILLPHHAWIAWSAIAFLILTEVPRTPRVPMRQWPRLVYGMTPVLAGVIVLCLSGLLGLLLFHRSPLTTEATPFSFLPAIVGLFAMPGLVSRLMECGDSAPLCAASLGSRDPGSRGCPGKAAPSRRTPYDFRTCSMKLHFGTLVKRFTPGGFNISTLQGLGGGVLAGGLTAIAPVLTGTVGGLMADRLAGPTPHARLIAQGAARMIAIGGGLLLVFMPGTPRLHTGSAALLRSVYVPAPTDAPWPYAVMVVVGAGVACLLLPACMHGLGLLIRRWGEPLVSGLTVLGLGLAIGVLTQGAGLLVLATATGIGLIAPLFNARPIHGAGLLLIPLACQVSGIGAPLADWFGWWP